MLPPVLEVYVVWHPDDAKGREIADQLVQHFHGTLFSGLIGGAVEVYVRSRGWRSDRDSPRPIPFDATALPYGMREARFVAVVPILGSELATAVQHDTSAWKEYILAIMAARSAHPHRVGVFPYLLDKRAIDQTVLGGVFSGIQSIAANPPRPGETESGLRCRDLTQGIAQLLSPTRDQRLTVFISHTKRNSPGEAESVEALIETVRNVIGTTRLREFFDANDLQPGQDWDTELRTKAATSALLAIRTDLYPSREWCQREMLISKRAGMPVIIMDALGDAEERGSFLMDHVPRVAARMTDGQWRRADIQRGLNLLVDECLKRVLWRQQEALSRDDLDLEIAWWAPHAPEPITMIKWLDDERAAGKLHPPGRSVVVLHPDPPLGPDEKSVLQELLVLGGIKCDLDVMTPRLLAARGG